MERADEAAVLCNACGLCCDGTMFHHVNLRAEDSLSADARRHLRMIDATRFVQPCGARGPSNGCAIYTERPGVCREYRCDLLRAHLEEGGDLAAKLAKVRRARAITDRLRARAATEGAAGWLFDDIASMLEAPLASLPDEVRLDIAELGLRLQRDFGKTFGPK